MRTATVPRAVPHPWGILSQPPLPRELPTLPREWSRGATWTPSERLSSLREGLARWLNEEL